MKRILVVLCALQLLSLTGCKTKVLTPEQQAQIERNTIKIEKPDFTFIPDEQQFVGGKYTYLRDIGSRQPVQLDFSYYLSVSSEAIEVYLPYSPFFGKKRVTPMTPDEIGIKFRSTQFEYTSKDKGKGKYEIKIVPKDVTDINLSGIYFILDIDNKGGGSLRFGFTHKQATIFKGIIE